MRRGLIWDILFRILIVLILLFLLAPIIAVVGGSFGGEGYFSFPPKSLSLRWYEAAFRNKEHLSSLRTSLTISFAATILASALCIPATIALKKSRSRIAKSLNLLFMAPIFLPAIVWAVGMLQWMGMLGVRGSFPLLVLTHTVLITPYMIRVVGTSLDEFNFELEDAAASLGATPARTFVHITLPNVIPGVIVGAVFGFMISFSDLIITLFVSSSGYTTFPVRVYSEMRTEGLNPMVLSYSAIIVLVVLVISVLGEKFARWSRFFSADVS